MLQLFKQYFVAVAIGFVLLILFIFHFKSDDTEEIISDFDDELYFTEEFVEKEETLEEPIVVDIKGEINEPGVYFMNNGDRLVDLIERAGGLTKNANEKSLNLAMKLTDEMVIVVPNDKDETLDEYHIIENGTVDNNDKLAINKASLEELTRLNGIGPKKAQAIIDYIEENGPFNTVDDILNVSGIGEKTLESFKDEIIVP